MKRGIPTVIIEPRTLLREGLAALLQDSSFKVIACLASADAAPQLPPGRPGLLIIGLGGTTDDPEVLARISAAAPGCKVVAVADRASQAAQIDVLKIMRSGADGYILNVKSRDVLLRSLELAFLEQKLVVLGDKCETADADRATPARSGDAPPRPNRDSPARAALSERELDILGCLAAGDSNKVIARNCRIAESTVKIHLKSILRKIHVQNRTQAAIWALRNNLVVQRGSPPVAPMEFASPAGLPRLLA